MSHQVDKMTTPNKDKDGDDDLVVSQSPAGKKGVCSHYDDSDDRDNDIVFLPYQQNVYSQ